MDRRLSQKSVLIRHIQRVLHESRRREGFPTRPEDQASHTSAVLLLLGWGCPPSGNNSAPCLVLNKRSARVRQPGDLCCPGGSIDPGVDRVISRLLTWPLLSFGRWPFWSWWKSHRRPEARWLALCYAAALRESFEEIVKVAAEHGWGEYRTAPAFQDAVVNTYSFNDHALRRFHETLKDAIDPHGIISPGRYGIWPKHLRKKYVPKD